MSEQNDLQNNAQWFNDRLFHFTSSELHKLLTKPKSGDVSKTAEGYIFDKLAEELTNGTCLDYNEANSRETKWGHAHEPDARAEYEARTGRTVELCGFFEWSESFGGSPDGLVGDNGMIEIKCPYNTVNHIRNLMLETAADFRKLRPEYYTQIQGNLLATGRQWCDFISYDPRCQVDDFTIKVLRIERDEAHIEEIIKALHRSTKEKNEKAKRIIELCMK